MRPAVKGGARDTRFALVGAARPVLATSDQFAAEIARLWGEAHERFVQIGDHLDEAKAHLPHGEFLTMVEERLPFGRGVAHKLMVASRAIRDGTVPAALAPPNYSTVYQIATLSDEERRQALDAGVIRPDARREDIIAFKKTRRPCPQPDRRAAIEDEIRRLKARIEALERELKAP